jgi:peroxiredoxin
VKVFTVAWQDATYGSVDTSECASWASYYGLTFPVLADSDEAVYFTYRGSDGGRPLYVLLDRDMIVRYRGTGRSAHDEVEALLADYL